MAFKIKTFREKKIDPTNSDWIVIARIVVQFSSICLKSNEKIATFVINIYTSYSVVYTVRIYFETAVEITTHSSKDMKRAYCLWFAICARFIYICEAREWVVEKQRKTKIERELHWYFRVCTTHAVDTHLTFFTFDSYYSNGEWDRRRVRITEILCEK